MKTIVLKVGGALLEDQQLAIKVLRSIKTLSETSAIVLVHGGGDKASNLLTQLGLETKKVDGLRVTPASQIDYVVGALAGSANKTLCALANQSGLNAIGLSLFDGKSIKSEQLDPTLGNVGTALPDEPALLKMLTTSGYFPIVSSIGCDAKGKLLNVNADHAATAVAALLDAELVFLSDVSGVLDGEKNHLASLSSEQSELLIAKGVISDGMVVKVKAAQDAATTLGRQVTIGSWHNIDALITHQNKKSGTQIFPMLVKEHP